MRQTHFMLAPLLFLAFFAALTVSAETPITYDHLIARINDELHRGKFAEAAADADDAVKRDPERFEAYALSGVALLSMNDLDDAQRAIEIAIKRAPVSRRAAVSELAGLVSRQRQFAKLEYDGNAASESGEHAKAADCFYEAWKLFPERPDAGMPAAASLGATGDYARCREVLRSLATSADAATAATAKAMLVKLEPVTAEKYQTLMKSGLSAMKSNLTDVAASAFQQAVSLYPEKSNSRLQLARALMRTNDQSKALEQITEACRLGYPQWETLVSTDDFKPLFTNSQFVGLMSNTFGREASELVRAMAATSVRSRVAALEQLHRDFPDDERILPFLDASRQLQENGRPQADQATSIARQLERAGKLDDAEKSYKRAAALEPDNAQRFLELGHFYERTSRWEDLVQSYRDGLRISPDDPTMRSGMGNGLIRLKKYNEAAEQFREAVKLDPTAANHDSLGRALFMAGSREQGLAEFKEAVRIEPSNSTYQSHLQQAQGQ